jgi:hypothetical protein
LPVIILYVNRLAIWTFGGTQTRRFKYVSEGKNILSPAGIHQMHI